MSSLTLKKAALGAIKAIGDEGTFEGYASTFGVLDQGGDIVVKGAYAKTLADRGPRGIKLLFDHNPSCPIGLWEELREDDTGLFGRGRLLLEVEKGREVHTLIRAGAIDGLSIGYRVVDSERGARPGSRLLQEIDLREISVVTFPMNETSLISSVKGDLPTEREFERWLTQDAGFSRSQARTIIQSGFKSLPNVKPGADDAGASRVGEDWGDLVRGLDRLSETLTR